jgi:murein DD-endopeptidase MepM/ murein hydrolase activator NlpD
VDFAREVQVNDRWRLSVEQKLVKGQPIGWGAILAAEYINVGESHRATLFRIQGEDHGYFTPEGQSLRKVFLKSPIRYGRITSGFKRRRFHPVLQVYRAHQGVDYGAPTGTPVRSVGDGTVIFAARSGGGGNVVKIRHNATYQTAYKHLHGYAKGIRNGARVKQGQVIGYVGSTGLSTGPHLHFEFYQSGRYIDPLGKKFPSADPVPAEHLTSFKTSAEQLLKTLPEWDTSPAFSADQRFPTVN